MRSTTWTLLMVTSLGGVATAQGQVTAQQRDSAAAVPMKPAAVTRGWPNDSTKRDDLRSEDIPELNRMQFIGASLVLAATIADVTHLVPLRGPAPQRKLNVPLASVFIGGIALIVGGMDRRVWTEHPRQLAIPGFGLLQ